MPARRPLRFRVLAAAALLFMGVLVGYASPRETPDTPGAGEGEARRAGDGKAPVAGPGRARASGDGKAPDDRPGRAHATGPGGAPAAAGPRPRPDLALTRPGRLPAELPGLGPRTRARVPRDARQVVVVTGAGRHSSRSTVVLYERTAAGWQAGPAWPAHNALRGWTDHHRLGDLRSPRGVFGLTDAGGLRPDPGTKLPYDHSAGFIATGVDFEGEPLAGAFDYVIAINYNRVAGTSPLDWTRPLGAKKGGGIWIHVDHDGPTHGCVSLSLQHMERLLRTLDPDRHPVVVMGDARYLAR
ncbi:L,D-transpeptidase family protein [Streptomyces sp. XD-27]|uniref:L,D-transpeptidase family protein n=1 Tax=Streptomyces sp. XD-27 TaxID=3062779 RepID=UPI0026F46A4C|nr:L,D-transpeptidase family protein [Streptomyces sp. XD-27]WKX71417.1 L,D-transpeptidase family protein [Streptomyces sp. XD-27]